MAIFLINVLIMLIKSFIPGDDFFFEQKRHHRAVTHWPIQRKENDCDDIFGCINDISMARFEIIDCTNSNRYMAHPTGNAVL